MRFAALRAPARGMWYRRPSFASIGIRIVEIAGVLLLGDVALRRLALARVLVLGRRWSSSSDDSMVRSVFARRRPAT